MKSNKLNDVINNNDPAVNLIEVNNNISKPITPEPMVVILHRDTSPYPCMESDDSQIPSLAKGMQQTPMIRFDYVDGANMEAASVNPAVYEPMITFDDESTGSHSSLDKPYSVPLVTFEEGIDPKTFPDPFIAASKNSESEIIEQNHKLHIPVISKKAEVSILTDSQRLFIKRRQDELNMIGNALQIAEELFCGTDFNMEGGVIFNKVGEKVCNFVLWVESETVHYYAARYGEYARSEYKFHIYINHQKYDANVWGDDLYSSNWLNKFTSGRARIYTAGRKGNLFNDILCDFINRGNYTIYHYYHTNGWHDLPNAGHNYLTDKGAIGMNISNISATKEYKLIYDENSVGSITIFQDIIRMMNNVCLNSDISTLIILYTHLGVLTTLFDQAEFPIKFIVALIGVTNSRKTSLALNLTKLFDRCTSPKPDISFEATVGGIETSFSKYHDAVFLVDDLKPSESKEKQKEMAKKLETIVRAYGDRVPKSRMNDYAPRGKDVYYPITGCCMITGEYLDGVASTLARIVTINIGLNDVNNAELRHFQENHKILSTHMVDFISYIRENYDYFVSYITNRMQQIRNSSYSEFDIPRYAESYATFVVCAEIFIGYAKSRGFFTDVEAEIYLKRLISSIYNIIAASDSSITDHNPGIITLQAIDNYLTSGVIKIYSTGQSPSQNEEFYAYLEEDFICIQLDVAFRVLIKYVRSLNSDPSVTKSKQLLPYLAGLDVIRIEKRETGVRCTHKLSGRTTEARFLFIKRSRMVEILNKENSY